MNNTFLAVLLAAAAALLPSAKKDGLPAAAGAWLAEHREIVFAGQISYPPFEFIHPRRGDYTGMTVELIRWIGTEYGFNAVFKPMPFAAAQDALLRGDADVLTGLFRSDERELRFDFSAGVFSVPASIFVRSERTDIMEAADLAGKLVAVQRGDYAIEYLASLGVEARFVYTDDFTSALSLVAGGEADALVGDEQITYYHVYDSRLTGAIKKVGTPLYVGDDCFAVAKGDAMLLAILDAGLEKARASGTLDRIYAKWVGVDVSLAPPAESRDWIRATVVVLAVVAASVLASFLWTRKKERDFGAAAAASEAAIGELRAANEALAAANAQLARDMEERSRLENDRRKLEATVAKSRNYESVAAMAGSMVHDFTNLLTSIIGNVDLCLLSLDGDSEDAKRLAEAVAMARRAGELANRLLSYSGLGSSESVLIDLAGLARSLMPVLASISAGGVPLAFDVAEEELLVRGDSVQLGQAMYNLAQNAVEASRGTSAPVVLRVAAADLDAASAASVRTGAALRPGRYALVELSDQGRGMDDETAARVFDPFFTTKEGGRGLGLVATAGIVRAHGGAIGLSTAPGMGSSFRVYLPLASG